MERQDKRRGSSSFSKVVERQEDVKGKEETEDDFSALYPHSLEGKRWRSKPQQQLIKKAISRKKTNQKRKRSKVDNPKNTLQGNKQQDANIAVYCPRDGKKTLKSKWTVSARFQKWGPNACVFLPVPEDTFLEDMVAENPCYKSNSQQKPEQYWKNAAALIPPCIGHS
ncbi:unnamed protein product [Lepidochelys olivacea]